MKLLKRSDLKGFQERAADSLAGMILEYPSARFQRFDPDNGELLPFLCRLRAITGAGKTPILSWAANKIKTGIVLWTTNRGALISQTLANLRPGGKYSLLLPEGTQVFLIGEMSPQDWAETISRKDGLTILLATVASFNKDGDELRIHRKQGKFTNWEKLGGTGDGRRNRQLYVFYDEGHGATERQFDKLRELNPRAFVLASASPLPEDLADLLSGRTAEEREKSLAERTVAISTKQVVGEGLLKNRLYFIDCNTAKADAIKKAHDRWKSLSSKLAPHGKVPIACFIVNDTQRGVDVWEHLVKLKIPSGKIAVHLNKAREVIADRKGSSNGLIDTYTGKQAEDRSPQVLREQGFTHIIWNLTLREGWDEPLAYVAYIDQQGRSVTDVVQKIGRFVRQPDAEPFKDADLNSAYFYFNITDKMFTDLIEETQSEMQTEGYEVIGMSRGDKSPASRIVKVKKPASLQSLAPWFGQNVADRDKILLNHVPDFSDQALKATGSIRTRVFKMDELAEDEKMRTEETHSASDVITPWEYLCVRLGTVDSRIVQDDGTIFSATLRDNPKLRQRMQFGSEAMTHLDRAIPAIRNQLNELFSLASLGKHGQYPIQPFNLVSPDITGVTDAIREKYKTRRYTNSLHTEYNGMNPFEVAVASALDKLGKPWCRNPATKEGYRIPIPELGSDNMWFYPDFLLWSKKQIWAIDPKGKHLLEAAVVQKLLDLSSVSGVKPPINVAFVLDGTYNLDSQGSWNKAGKDGFTLVRRSATGPKPQHAPSLQGLVAALVKN